MDELCELPIAKKVKNGKQVGLDIYPLATSVVIVPVMDSVIMNEVCDLENPYPGLSIENQEIIQNRIEDLIISQPYRLRQQPKRLNYAKAMCCLFNLVFICFIFYASIYAASR